MSTEGNLFLRRLARETAADLGGSIMPMAQGALATHAMRHVIPSLKRILNGPRSTVLSRARRFMNEVLKRGDAWDAVEQDLGAFRADGRLPEGTMSLRSFVGFATEAQAAATMALLRGVFFRILKNAMRKGGKKVSMPSLLAIIQPRARPAARSPAARSRSRSRSRSASPKRRSRARVPPLVRRGRGETYPVFLKTTLDGRTRELKGINPMLPVQSLYTRAARAVGIPDDGSWNLYFGAKPLARKPRIRDYMIMEDSTVFLAPPRYKRASPKRKTPKRKTPKRRSGKR